MADESEFAVVLCAHMTRYPRMQAQDMVKLAYQSAFGPGHLHMDFSQAQEGILTELAKMENTEAQMPTYIGNGMSRFALATAQDGCTTALLARLFRKSCASSAGGTARFEAALQYLQQTGGAQTAAYIAAYMGRRPYEPVHHSETYRTLYRPHYRVIRARYADFFPALLALQCGAGARENAIIAIDGRCGSGKSTLASVIEEFFACNVIHMDDFFLPPMERKPGWEGEIAGNMDIARLREQVLLPLRAGREAAYRPYSCKTGAYGEEKTISPHLPTVVEGSYSLHPALTEFYDGKIFLTCSSQTQKFRLEEREGADIQMFQDRWIPMEERYFAACEKTRNGALCLETDGFDHYNSKK